MPSDIVANGDEERPVVAGRSEATAGVARGGAGAFTPSVGFQPSPDAWLWRDIAWFAAHGIVAVDAATRHIIACNPAYARVHGYARVADLVGTSVDLLYAPEERVRIPGWLVVADAVGAHYWESVHLRADGSRFPVEISLSPVRDATGTVRYRVATTEDITARHEREAERERLLAAEADARRQAQRLLDLTTALARTARVVEAAEVAVSAGLDALGASTGGMYLTREDGSLGLAASRGFPDDVVAGFRDLPSDADTPTVDVIRAGAARFFTTPVELAAAYPHLAAVWEGMGTRALACVPLTLAGRCIGALGYAFAAPRDFSTDERAFATALAQQAAQALERARLFEAEREAREAADAANRAKARFLATMSHELRTPINAALGHVQLVTMGIHGPVTAAQVAALDRVRASQQLLLARIDDVLTFARVEAGRLTYRREVVPVATLLDALHPLLAPLLDGKQLRLERAPVEEGLAVYADPGRVQQVLLNLVSNAVKFTPAGGAITLRGCDVPGAATSPLVGIEVRDTGIGIPPAMHERIFEPFVQVTEGDAVRGTGLGLAISRELARGMGGDLTVESAPGAGAKFTLLLPRAVTP